MLQNIHKNPLFQLGPIRGVRPLATATPSRPQAESTSAFIVRVVLHGAPEETYRELHDAMAAVGLARKIVGDDGVTYQLPDAEYFGRGEMSAEQVRGLALEVANSVHANAAVLVTQMETCVWAGLNPIDRGI